MSNPRKRYLRAMVEGVFGLGPVSAETLDQWRPGLLAALDMVEPLIRADERERIHAGLAEVWQEGYDACELEGERKEYGLRPNPYMSSKQR